MKSQYSLGGCQHHHVEPPWIFAYRLQFCFSLHFSLSQLLNITSLSPNIFFQKILKNWFIISISDQFCDHRTRIYSGINNCLFKEVNQKSKKICTAGFFCWERILILWACHKCVLRSQANFSQSKPSELSLKTPVKVKRTVLYSKHFMCRRGCL